MLDILAIGLGCLCIGDSGGGIGLFAAMQFQPATEVQQLLILQTQTRQAVDEIPQDLNHPPQSGAAWDINLPQSMSPARMQWFARVLCLDDSQVLIAEHWHRAYLKQWDALHKEHYQELSDLTHKVRKLQDEREDFEAARLFVQFVQEREALRQSFEKLDDAFLNDVQSILNPEQIDRYPRIEDDRRREQHAFTHPGAGIPGSGNELIQVIREIVCENDLSPELYKRLLQFETTLTSLLVSRFERRLRFDLEEEPLRASRMFDDDGRRFESDASIPPGRVARANRRLGDLRSDFVRVERAIKNLNEQFLQVLVRDLPPPTNLEVRRRYYAVVYPLVYPDDIAVTFGPVIEDVVALESLDPSIVEAIHTRTRNYEMAHDHVSEEMRVLSDAWRLDGEREPERIVERHGEYTNKMADLKQRRIDLTLELANNLRVLLGPRVAAVPSLTRFLEHHRHLLSEGG